MLAERKLVKNDALDHRSAAPQEVKGARDRKPTGDPEKLSFSPRTQNGVCPASLFRVGPSDLRFSQRDIPDALYICNVLSQEH